MPVETIQYKGQPILKIQSDEIAYLKIQIGLKKAKLVI